MAAAIAQAQRITVAQAKDAGTTYAQTVDSYALSVRSAVAVTGLSLIVAVAVGIALVGAISAPLRRVIELSEGIAAGDLTRSIETRSRDEIGQMTAALARMQDGIRRMVADVRHTGHWLPPMRRPDTLAFDPGYAVLSAHAGRIGRSRAGRPRVGEMQERIGALLHIAGELFLQHGYSGTSLGLIAREGGVAARTIYQRFGGKAGLFGAVIARWGACHGVTELPEDENRSLAEILSAVGEQLLQVQASPHVKHMYRMVIAEGARHPAAAEIFHATGRGQLLAILAAFFSRADIASQCRPGLAPSQLAHYLVNCICGDELSWLLSAHCADDAGADRGQRMEQGLDLFCRAVLIDPPPLP